MESRRTSLHPVTRLGRRLTALVVLTGLAVGLVGVAPALASPAAPRAVAGLPDLAGSSAPAPSTDPTPASSPTPPAAPVPAAPPVPGARPGVSSFALPRRTTTSVTTYSAKSDPKAAAAPADPAAAPASGTAGTFTLGPATVDLLARQLSIPVGTGELTGTVSGSTFTATVSGPTIPPIPLPAGYGTLAFGDTSISIDINSKSLTLSTAATAGTMTGQLDVTITDVGSSTPGADAHVQLFGVPVFGVPVDFDGHLAYSGGTLTGSITGTLRSNVSIAGGALVLQAGSTFTIDRATGLHVQASAVTGGLTLDLDGAVASANDWAVSAHTTGASWSPGAGFTLTPNLTGSVASVGGAITFDLAADQLVSWQTSGPTFSITHIELANTKAPDDCPASTQGKTWFAASGTIDFGGNKVDAHACLNLADRTFHIDSTLTGSLATGAGFSIDHLGADVSGNLSASTVELAARAKLHITANGANVTVDAGISYQSGTLVAGASLTDPTALGFGPNDTGRIYIATGAVQGFPIRNLFPGVTGTIDLGAGVTVTVSFHLPQAVRAALSKLHITADTVDATASLTSAGFDLGGTITFAPAIRVFNVGNSTWLDLNNISLKLHLGTDVAVTLGAQASLHTPSLLSGAPASDVGVAANATLDLTSSSLTLGFTLAGTNGGPWTNAFGIPGMEVGSLSATLGIDAAGVPILGISARNVKLPPDVAGYLGLSSTASVTLQLSTDQVQPVLNIALDPGASGWALKPLTIATSDPVVRDSFRIDNAVLRFAPNGGRIGAETIPAGIQVKFKANILGTQVTVDARLDLAKPSLSALIDMGTVRLGSGVSIPGAKLTLDIAPSRFSFTLAGSFTDTTTNTRFDANVALHAAASVGDASISLKLVSGNPDYLKVDALLTGKIVIDPASGVPDFSAAANGTIVIAGSTLGTVNFTYSSKTGAFWKQITGSANDVAAQLKYWYGYSSNAVVGVLNQLHWDQMSTVNAVASAGFSDFATAVNNFFHPAAKYIWSSDGQVLDVEYASHSVNARVIQWLWNGGSNQKWIWVPFPADPLYGELVSVNSGMCLSVVSFSTVPGANLVQGPCVGHDAQLFKFMDVGGGYSTIKNRNSGFVLDVYQASILPQTPIVQWYWNGSGVWNQKFYTTPAYI